MDRKIQMSCTHVIWWSKETIFTERLGQSNEGKGQVCEFEVKTLFPKD